MSFTENIKNELCRMPMSKECCVSAEVLGILLYGNRFATDKIRLISASYEVRRRVQSLFRILFNTQLDEEGDRDNSLVIEDEAVISSIFDWYGFQYRYSPLWLNRAVIEEECCRSAFLRGCFLMGGYATVAQRGYHLELVTSHFNVSNQVDTLLREMNMGTGSISRRGNYVLYYKSSDKIESFLTYIGAPNCAMNLMLTKVEKSLVNKVNRGVNCETANLDKVINAAGQQVRAVEKLEKAGKLDELPRELKETAMLRRQNPMASLSELAAMHEPPMSKSGISVRLKRIIKISEEL